MAKNISSIKDLVIQTITNGSEIEASAKNNDAEACFQMGMIYLLGILSPIDFNKAAIYFGNQSLADDSDANRLLGFIAECEGNYSKAFKHFVKAKDTTGKSKNIPLYNKVFEERNYLREFFKNLALPNTVLNKDVSDFLNEYVKGGTSRFDASVKIATICNDELSCLEVAQILYDMGDFYAAKRWLQNGNVSNTNDLYVSVEEKIAKTKNGIDLPNIIEVVEIEGLSLIEKSRAELSYTDSKYICDETAKLCIKEWTEQTSSKIAVLKKEYSEEEETRRRKQKEEETRIKRQKEEEEEARVRREQEAILQAQFEKKEKKYNKAKRIINKIYIFWSVLSTLLFLLGSLISGTFAIIDIFIIGIGLALLYFPFYIVKWIIKKIIMR